jgi:dTDP-4-amino-4,6-dideoxygalactose transaminase
LTVDPRVIPEGGVGLARALKDRDIVSAPRYIQKPAFMCEIFQKQRTFGNSRWPLTLARREALDYDPARFPGTTAALDNILVFPWNEQYTDAHVDYIARSIREAVAELSSCDRSRETS